MAVKDLLSPLKGQTTPQRDGMYASLFVLVVVTVFAMWGNHLNYLGALWPGLGLIAAGLMAPRCTSCFTKGRLDMALPIFLGLAAFAFALIVLGVPKPKHACWYVLVMLLSVAVLVGQAQMLHVSPKFCVPCLLVSVAASGSFCSAISALSLPKPRFVQFGRRPVVVGLALTGVFFMQHAQAMGAQPEIRNPVAEASFIGRSLADFGVPTEVGQGLRLVLVSSVGCHSCSEAKSFLSSRRIAYAEHPICTLLPTAGRFLSDKPTPVPLVLVVDARGRILFSHLGWSDDPRYNLALAQQIDSILGGNKT